MITAAAVVPHPPLLLRELGGATDPVPGLRSAALEAVASLTETAEEVLLVGPAGTTADWDPTIGIGVHRFGTPQDPSVRDRTAQAGLPLSLAVGVRLLAEAGWTGPVRATAVAHGSEQRDLESLASRTSARTDRTGVLVLGDGSARRGERAPGYLDPRAFPFDDGLADALASGDGDALAGLDPVLADELMVGGIASFRFLGLLAGRCPRKPACRLTHREDPFGVTYLVATWTWPGR